MIQQAMSIACQHLQDEYKAKFILKSHANALAENKSIFNWFYEKLTQLNVRYPWNLIGQQLDENNDKLFLIQYTFQLILHDLSIRLANLEKLFHSWFILSIIYWIGFVLWFTKCILLLPHVAGACSACNDLKEQQLLFASKWFNSTFLIAMNNHSIDIDQLIEKCKENSSLWSVNYFIRLGLLDTNVDQNVSRDKMNMEHLDVDEYYPLNYLTASIITAISHCLLYLITIRLRRCIQKHNYQHKHFNFSFQSSPIFTRHHSIILPWNQNKQDDIETTEYENQVQ
ncbi:unnamed protein product [Rotaria socialis]|uniref:Uncharacterized protein n=1 Tax=Rotaria socialis TaxID=392032 RepID=A0A820D5Z2_9BILA|nr:unnamed protein product [Rotaria socialis]